MKFRQDKRVYEARRAKLGLGKKKAPVKSMNVSGGRYKPYAPLPKCPKCGAQTSVIDMKHNDRDEFGQLYENYRCPVCPCWFTITYDGPDDTYDWSYDE